MRLQETTHEMATIEWTSKQYHRGGHTWQADSFERARVDDEQAKLTN